MKELQDKLLLKRFISQFSIDKYFGTDFTQHAKLLEFSKGETILQMGSELKYFYFHVKGKAEICFMLDNGKSLLFRFSKPLTILGEVEIFSSPIIQCNVEAIEQCILIGIKVEDLKRHYFSDPVFLRFIVSELCEKLKGNNNNAPINLLYPLKFRLISFLLSLIDNGNKCKRVEEIKTYKINEIAMLLGTSYRHLNRVINELIKEGILERSSGEMVIVNTKKIKEQERIALFE